MAVESQQPERINWYRDCIALDLIRFDSKVAFVRWIHYKAQSVGGYDVYQSVMLSDIVQKIALKWAVKCATAVLQGETGLKLDNNERFKIIGPFVCYPHRKHVDIRFNGQLPLNIAVEHMREQPAFIGRSTTTRQSLYMMIVFCQCETEILRSVRNHFRCTKENEAEKEIYRYAKDGKLVEIATLLMVDPENVTSPSLFKGLHDPSLDGNMSLRQLVLSEIVSLMASQITLVSTSEEVHDELNNKLETMMSMLHLIEVFERVGDKIELFQRYSYKFITKLSKEEFATHMACLLISEGFAEYKDFDLKRSVSCEVVTKFHKDFLELLESKLSGENEGTRLEGGTTKICRKQVVGSMWIPRLSYRPPTLEAIPILNNEDDAKGYLSLKEALEKLCNHPYLKDWTPKESTFKIVCILCLPQLKKSLESIRLVACKTEEIEAIGCDLARQGKLVELASLLMVALEKLIITTSEGSSHLRSNVVRRCIMSDLQASLDAEVRLMGRSNSHKLAEKFKDEREMKLSALKVLEVFERAGSSINRYLQSDAYNDGTRSNLEMVGEIQNLFEKAVLDLMKPRDTYLNDIKCFSPTLDPVDHTSLPLAYSPHEFSVAEKKHLLGMQRGLPRAPLVQGPPTGSRPFHTMVMVQGNRNPQVSAPKSKAIPNVIRRSIRWFLSAGIKRV